jgi:hypothetical protein
MIEITQNLRRGNLSSPAKRVWAPTPAGGWSEHRRATQAMGEASAQASDPQP